MPADHAPDPGATATGLAAIARPTGIFAMLAIDQRESLRTLLTTAGHPDTDTDLTAFKVDVARALSPVASGMLIDRVYGLDAVVALEAAAPTCGLIVAVDRLIQPRGGTLRWSELDPDAITDDLPSIPGVAALKFLVVWRPDDPVEPRAALVRAFLAACRRLALVSVLEGLVQLPAGAPADAVDAAILAAAREFAPFQPDLYKTHVPTHGHGTADEIATKSAAITEAIGRPWVVLSAGVPEERFADAVAAAGAGGASGFLAGRGVWAPAIRTVDPAAALRADSRSRLAALVAVADATARPWTSVDQVAPGDVVVERT